MKETQLSFGILMTDFLEAALREMASSVPVALLCQSSSRHTSQLPAAKPIGCDRHSWQNAADGGTMGCAGQREFHRQYQTQPTLILSLLEWNGDITGAGRCGDCDTSSLPGFRLLSLIKKKVSLAGYMLTSTVAERAGDILSLLISLSPSLHLHLF